MLEKTFFMVKPDGVSRGLVEDIFKRIEENKLAVVKQLRLNMALDEAADLYSPHLGKSFYPGLIKFITSGTVVCSVIEGEQAISRVRELMGATDPRSAAEGSIRGDLKELQIISEAGIIKNLVHGSDSPEAAAREIAIFFK